MGITTGRPKILFVDDVPCTSGVAEFLLEPLEADVDLAGSAEDALALLAGKAPYDLVVSGATGPDASGLGLLGRLRGAAPDVPVICLTGTPEPKAVGRAQEMGAFDLVPKPLDRRMFLRSVKRALDRAAAGRETGGWPGESKRGIEGWGIIGESEAMAYVLARVARVAETDTTVCISGESGTGKELVARAIHAASERRDRPLIVLDCAAVPDALMESELFGHTRGAFTGAVRDSPGVFALADGGTFFLDEVGELGLGLQAKLLRLLQTREFRRVGGTQTIKVDVRVVAATNRDLAEAVRQQRFRADLFYRLNVVGILLPPLRERPGDIPLLVHHFIRTHAARHRRPITGLSAQALGLLLGHDWPGNVRELENCIERAVVLAEGDEIGVEDVRSSVPIGAGGRGEPAAGRSLREVKREHILDVLSQVDASRTQAARILDISLRGLQYKLREYQAAPDTEAGRLSAAAPALPRSVTAGGPIRKSA
jgi:two-component system NtrC family response regulator/two-component system response regulator HydG